MALTFSYDFAKGFLGENDLAGLAPQVAAAHNTLAQKNGLGNDFLGWVDLPTQYDKAEFERIQKAAQKIRSDSEILIVIGIGGSYLGARAAIEFLRSPLHNELAQGGPKIYFAGNSISGAYLSELLQICDGKELSVNVISKSGTTTEPAIAFRVFRELLQKKYGAKASERIYCTTDKARGTLKALADREGYECFVIPDDVGGRFSVLTAVGLLPIAVSGANIAALMDGAAAAAADYNNPNLAQNPCYQYAALRNAFYRKGKQIELLVSYEPRFSMMAEWYKQLFGESEGKDHKGLFPAAVTFSTDLHSMGQYIQEGPRHLMETVVSFASLPGGYTVPADAHDGDGLNYLAGHDFNEIAAIARAAVKTAHIEGGVPNLAIEVTDMAETGFAELVCFFELACGISGYMEGVNPFDQPGVEAYKKLMFRGLAALK